MKLRFKLDYYLSGAVKDKCYDLKAEMHAVISEIRHEIIENVLIIGCIESAIAKPAVMFICPKHIFIKKCNIPTFQKKIKLNANDDMLLLRP